ncbi:MAG: Asp-tRNA(Asn)/Glu-tRNA(Gln) amidotransferase GatCAB subunit A [Candidatus Yonathbacteria bacterium CG_4_10_14_3_um_filter_47_65]|uniref:Glutamyl-tRNA(Gln) amidotransferase subunit A n=2 Tax=Parcubacteria group TaxID=1794811 RepID=A0A2M8D5Y6_9BACT|nr:MAG: glutaminyl-tRNA synthase (glutamine-hydrolyzing) subunit A [Candidatus Nomurabacteria bacterium CG1_02_47_685]PIP04001.1 MAG: Asp-tRNA(Asn)/Glu-tRNA(Gln) amidotransferase GatCAB subunit A [Candidatus Yonathbacteria bacterium CG23_combo_of_CG06-09_8_20_14_all_46_18]PIQ31218.1 MAG: Asp-tRNA(Asn)/Glu-tRNA(Gln) amidotransferase GatCAB subunit A [Candidatus Yonathbacteria bacterium CG17_big_fil_post_rev_8_21_14_2_50_46_19]PIX56456.1 MAG: Asp-tRNA(Asn)/Glu-tRNA(Gln) amidotransferase GatCAB sub
MKIDTDNLTVASAMRHLRAGDFSARELTEAYLKNIEERDRDIHAYLEIFDDAIEFARAADVKIKKGEAGVLAGIPMAVKDNMLVEGKYATAASKILKNYRSTYDATAVKKIKDAGAVMLGRTNMDEFAMGSSTESSAYGITRNPRDESRVPGGSSGGSAAAVSMGGVLAALGSDTGGSIRQPASFCGVVGLKPTYGSVSRHGLIAMASSLDQIGPLAKTVEDAELVFNVIKGFDRYDSTSFPEDMYHAKNAQVAAGKHTIGIPADFLSVGGIDAQVLESFNRSVGALKDAGNEIREIALPHAKHALAAYYIIMPAEVSANLARFDGVRYGLYNSGADLATDYASTRARGFGDEVRRRILLGTYVLSSGYYDSYYGTANIVRDMVASDFRDAFKIVDVIAVPTAPTFAFKIGEKNNNPLQMYLEDIFTVPANIAGIPAISIPSGSIEINTKLIPIGMQFMAPHLREDILFAIGKDVEAVRS